MKTLLKVAFAIAILTASSATPRAEAPQTFAEGFVIQTHRMTAPVRATAQLSASFLAVGQGPYLMILDNSDPASPRVASEMALAGMILDMAAYGNTLYIATGKTGLRVIDVSNPFSPKEIAVWSKGIISVLTLSPDGQHLYLTVSENAVRVLNVSDPSKPKSIGAFGVKNANYLDLETFGDVLLAAAGPKGLYAYNVTIPKEPVLVSRFHELEQVSRVDVGDHVAVVLGDIVDGGRVLGVIEYSEWKSPVLKGQLLVDPEAVACGIMTSSPSRVVIGNASNGYSLADISNTSLPSMLGTWVAPAPVTALETDLYTQFCYLSCGSGGLYRVYLADQPVPEPPSKKLLDGAVVCRALATKGNLAYISTESATLETWDLADPIQPVRLSVLETPETAVHLGVYGDLLVASCQDSGFIVYDTSEATYPRQLSAVNPHSTSGGSTLETDMVVNTLAVADSSNGLLLYDMSTPSNPVPILSQPWVGKKGYVRGVEFQGLRTLWCTHSVKGLIALSYDPTSSSPLTELGSQAVADTMTGPFVIRGNYAYVCTAIGVQVFDIGTPSKPESLDIFTEVQAYDVRLRDGNLLVAMGLQGLWEYELSDPEKPSPVRAFDSPGESSSTAVTGSGTYLLADGEGGLFIMGPFSCAGLNLLLPCDGAAMPKDNQPLFTWEPGDNVKFQVDISIEPGFPSHKKKTWSSNPSDANYLLLPSWIPGSKTWKKVKKYGIDSTLYWRVLLIDAAGTKTYSETRTFTF